MTPDDVTMLPRWLLWIAYGFGVAIRKVWLYLCAPCGAIALLGCWIASLSR